MADGTFGSNENRRIITDPKNRQERRECGTSGGSFLSDLRYRAGNLTPERWVDIVFGLLFLVSGIAIACNWKGFSDGLFYNILFPIIYVGGKILLIVVVIAIIIGSISFRYRRRRYW